MKRCPYCAEAIQDDAQLCPHCRMDLTAPPRLPQQAAPPPPPPPGYPQPGYVQPHSPGDSYPTAPPQTSGKATGSLIAGIAAYVILPFFAAIAAVILGHLALSEIKKSAGRLKGDGMAIAGLVLGYVQFAGIPFILIIAAIAIPNLIRSRMAANEAAAVGALRTITTAENAYSNTCPKIGYTNSLAEIGPTGTTCPEAANSIDSALASGTKRGYTFTPHVSSFSGAPPEEGFGWNADPISESTGTRHFFVDASGVIRYSTTGPADETSTAIQ